MDALALRPFVQAGNAELDYGAIIKQIESNEQQR